MAKDFLAAISRTAKPTPTACCMYGPMGIGKTEFGCQFKKPVFLIDVLEDGINTLKQSGLVDPTLPVMPAVESWSDTIDATEQLRTDKHDFGTAVIDTGGGMERLCHDHTCKVNYKGDWGEKGFIGFQRGFDTAIPFWRQWLVQLDRLRTERGMAIVMLCHLGLHKKKNASGDDYEIFAPALHPKTWAATSGWLDMTLYLKPYVEVVTDKKEKRGKGKGGQERIIYTTGDASFDAKHRHNLPPEIPMGTSGKEAHTNLMVAIKAGRKTNGGK